MAAINELHRSTADFPAAIDLAALDGSDGFRLEGRGKNDYSGSSVSSAGDINGDGFSDFLIGAPGANARGERDAGETYLIFGKADGFDSAVDLATLDGANGVRLTGVAAGDNSGFSVSSAGDFNGDGFDDIVIGAPSGAGRSYILFGQAGAFPARFDLSALDGGNGFRLDGIETGGFYGDGSGGSVSFAGDVNGDGFDDIIIGAAEADPGGDSSAGESYVVFGKAGGFAATFDLATLDGSNGFRLDGIDAADFSGTSVSSAGDVNGDGFDDIIIGAPNGDPGRKGAGESYVVFGKADGFAASIDLAALDGADGFRIDGIDKYDSAGISVSSAGDVNGDGLDDLIIAASLNGPFGENSYVVFGTAEGFEASLDLSTLDGRNGFRIDGAPIDGPSVSSAGDVNGDGFDDIVIGAADFFQSVSYVVFGKAGGFDASFDLGSLDGSNGFRLEGADNQVYTSTSVSSAGDVNGDGFDDLIIGGPSGDPGDVKNAGESYIVFGRAPTEAVKRIGAEADQTIRGGDFDDILLGRGGDDTLFGGGGGDRLAGGAGHDTLVGGGGEDRLAAGAGGDRLTGGTGADAFVLDDDLLDGDQARIADFAGGTDRFEIDAADFGGGLTPGQLDPEAFVANTTGRAEDADHRFIYNSQNGRLFYDADGSGAGEGVLLAILREAPLVTAGDFIVV